MANFNFNKVILGGRLTADPKLEVTPGGTSVTNFVIAVNKARKGREADGSADFFTVIAWRELAEFITLYFRKASSICIVGGIHSRKWVDKTTGQKRYTVEIWADEAYFVDAKTEMPLSPEKTGDMIADPGAEVLAGEAVGAGRPAPGMFATSGARKQIAEGMAEGDEQLPF